MNAGPRYVRLYNQTGAPADTDGVNVVWRGICPGNRRTDASRGGPALHSSGIVSPCPSVTRLPERSARSRAIPLGSGAAGRPP